MQIGYVSPDVAKNVSIFCGFLPRLQLEAGCRCLDCFCSPRSRDSRYRRSTPHRLAVSPAG